MSLPQRSEKSDVFFSSKNEGVLQRVLYTDICRRIGGDLNEKQASRLMKTVKHYMGEVYRVKGSVQNVQMMNTEVLQIVLPDYMMYMERVAASSERSAVLDIERGPGDSVAIAGAIEDREQLDVGTAFTQLQANRQNAKKTKMPEMQDFRLTLQDEGPVPMDVFERMKQDREAEAQRVAASASASAATSVKGQGNAQQTFAEATDVFARSRRRADQESEQAFAERERAQLQARAAAASAAQETLPMPPDMRGIILGDRQNLDRTMNRLGSSNANAAAGNPTLALGDSMRDVGPMNPTAGPQQMIITREPSTMAYKETELNLFVYSGDRNWAANSTETRYNFSVSFDPGNMPVGLRLSPTSTVKFRNIVRIELVKAIMPGESLDSLVTRNQETEICTGILINSTTLLITSISSGLITPNLSLKFGTSGSLVVSPFIVSQAASGGIGTYTINTLAGYTTPFPSDSFTFYNSATGASTGAPAVYATPYNLNVLSFPYVQVNIPELDNNNYGTNQSLNSAFGILQYDANWIYDTNNPSARGYFAMIPKFMKCQKVYQPTPLATLQKLTFNFQRPDGTPLSTIPDTLDIYQINSSKQYQLDSTFPYGYDQIVEENTSASYYFIRTKTWFSVASVNVGDRISMQNIFWSPASTPELQNQVNALSTYLQQASGLVVVALAYTNSGYANKIAMGANSQGYCNYIIVRGVFSDPTINGSVTTLKLAGVNDNSSGPGVYSLGPPVVQGIESGTLTDFLNKTVCASGRLLNQSHQVQVAMRIITREMDSTSVIRPDNL